MAKKEQDLQQVVENALAEQKVPHVKFKGIDPKNIDVDRLTKPSKETRQEWWGRGLTFLAIILIGILIVAIIGFVGMHGLATFIDNKVNIFHFLFSTDWNPNAGKNHVGAAAMIVTSFAVTLLAALIATPFSIAVALFMTEYESGKRVQLLQSVMELLVGIPSVVYGFIGLMVVVPAVRTIFGGTGFGILTATLILFVMVLPTITSLTVDAFKAIPKDLRKSSAALGATKWQTIYHVVLRAARSRIMTAVIFGMARAFGEALAVQMAIGNAVLMPYNLVSPAATLTSQLTSQMGNTVMGTLPNNSLWSLALLLLIMSLVFNFLVHLIGKKS
ncbi:MULTISPECIES: phosphate ABC transporter permease subunit PstC [Lactobacillus]|uniref:Phosphate transport system permease protein n=1 Tax=Lactobacillus kullabergensis TaxID=1218493 RepID=A0A0F4LBT0_9LACO|nr:MULTISPECIES: phosphate ABC transporter permease subunit PstC [Lactobacillus]AWM75679.1 phosphate ABC transporter permease subunit PstC [Lactobacillus kullabergensis]KGG53829.1 Phosphate transport system permease protein PstC [Lactobacillus sp. wkB10]KJY54996.1 Phosphate ABC transporter, permease protein PstC [Lactobacillus kullabergensis]MBC6341470.1 phosphate ABC transporter permease subunit PstC [Lactobacillus kimbladii]MBC6370188.1 phosphate ABC transporter permease subunit PstC [Lactob